MKRFAITIALLVAGTVYAQPQLQVIWDRSGAQDTSGYGYNVISLGDQNGDGLGDWAVFAVGGGTQAPMLEFFHGATPPTQQPYMVMHENSGHTEAAGDINGDGYIDWFIRANPSPSVFRIDLYWGGPDADTIADVSWPITGGDDFSPIGDFNGDGYADLYWYHWPGDYGQAFWGSENMDTIPDWTRHSPSYYPQQAYPWAGSEKDLNGDGYADFVSGTYPMWTTHIFLGGANPDTVPAYTWESLSYWPRGIVRDLNGDGFAELIYPHQEGVMDIYWGGIELQPVPGTSLNYPCTGIADEPISVGDFNHDGYDDLVLVSSHGYCDNAPWGLLSLYLGHPWIFPNPAFSLYGGGNLIGIWTAAGLGDVNGDGIDDLAVGAYTDNRQDGLRGRAIILAGDTDWVAGVDDPRPEIPQELSLRIYPNPFNSSTLIELSLPPTSSPVELALFNTLGQVAYRETLRPTSTTLRHTLSAEGLASGIYLLSCRAGDATVTKKILLMK